MAWNQCIQKKLLYFMNSTANSSSRADFKVNFLWFWIFHLKNDSVEVHFWKENFICSFNFWNILFSKIMPNFWQTVSSWIYKVQWFPLCMLIFGQKSCFLWPRRRQLFTWKVNICYYQGDIPQLEDLLKQPEYKEIIEARIRPFLATPLRLAATG